ncbi:MAG: sigma-70 family RNA polymerase sigma factor [Flavobacteriales bacterium]|nr:sigma-70 family RNA polymerase sigma factor [Flavobacteriales bacterium]
MKTLSEAVEIDITQLVNDHTEEMVRYTMGKISNQSEAQDIVQDTFIAAFGSAGNFKGDSNPKTWLYGILKHKILDYHRKNFRQPKQVEIADDKQDAFFGADGAWKKEAQPQSWNEEAHLLDNPDFNMQLSNCISKLPPKQGTAIRLKYQEDVNVEIIRKELGITATNYWQLLHRAKLQLRQCLENNWFKNENG